MNKAIIFDLDGTLVDSCGICVTILEAMLQDRGVESKICTQYARPFMSRGGETMVSALLGEFCHDASADLVEFRARYNTTETPEDALFEGVADGLIQLREAGYQLAICSNKPQHLCEKVLADTGLIDHFAVVVGSGHGLQPKPAPDLLDKTLEMLGHSAKDCQFVGDSELDHEIAVQAGMPFHFLTYGYATPGWAPTVGWVHDRFTGLVEELVRLGAKDLAA